MSKRPFASVVATLLIVTFIAPTAFFIAPQRASAAGGIAGAIGCLAGVTGAAGGGALGAGAVAVGLSVPTFDALNLAANSVSASATTGSCFNDTILMPLARLLARMVLQQITASIISWINGSNGTGEPSFVQNLSKNLQKVADAVAVSFINQVANVGFNAVFGPAISSALRVNYELRTSLAGFFAANQSTLTLYSPDVNAYLAGDWKQGAIAAWFALTTQVQNNPYTLYPNIQTELLNIIGPGTGGVTGTRTSELSWGQGFLSWCGANEGASAPEVAGVNCSPGDTYDSDTGTCVQSINAVSPGDACTSKNGAPGTIQTPGSVIHGYTQKAVVEAGIEQLITAQDLDQALGAIMVALVNQVLGGAQGLFGASSGGSDGSRSIVTQFQGYGGGGTTTVGSSSSGSAVDLALSRVAAYTTAVQTIATAANTASSSVSSLASFCVDAANTAARETGSLFTPISPTTDLSTIHSPFIDAARVQAEAAQLVITMKIAPVLAEIPPALATVATTKSFALKVQAESAATTSVTSTSAANLVGNIQTLTTMPPSATDLLNVQANASTGTGSIAEPVGSLTVSRGSIVDQMNLISTNATALKATVCNPNSSLYTTPSF